MTNFKPTEEQEAILAAVRQRGRSVRVNALAGTGKTTTLELIANALPANVSLAIAFNKKIADELGRRFPPNFVIKTFNGLGHGAWLKAIAGKRVVLDDRKLGKLVTEQSKAMGLGSLPGDEWDEVRRLVSSAMLAGIVPEGKGPVGLRPDTDEQWNDLVPDPEGVNDKHLALARAVLSRNIDLAREGTISFDDQIYCSVLLGGQYPQFPVVLVDEAQDLNELNMRQVEMCLFPASRLFVCGDPKQAIYAFRGSVSGSMDRLRALRPADTWIDLPLATTFRCPKVVVARQHRHAPTYRAAEGNKEGSFLTLPLPSKKEKEAEGLDLSVWRWDDVARLADNRPLAVLCRNNAPLLSLAFKLIRRGTPCVMLGREIGKGLVALAKKLEKDDEADVLVLLAKVNEWEERERTLARLNDKEHLIEGIEDRAECLRAVADGAKTAGDVRAKLARLFETEHAKVTLASGHKSKGLEWPVVLHLDPWRLPSRFAKGNPIALEQEMNLKYVIETRTKDVLLEANLEDYDG